MGAFLRSNGETLIRFLSEENGPTAAEYAVMLALIIAVCIATVATLGANVSNKFAVAALGW